MATATAAKGKGILANMTVENKVTTPVRGRAVSEDVLAIRGELDKCVKDGTVRSFTGVTKDDREVFARKIRAAGTLRGHDEIKVSTRFIESEGKLIWGPTDVMNKLSQAS